MADATTKAWYLSKGMWAGILTTALGIYGVIQGQYAGLHLPSLSAYAPIAFAVLGALGIFGRIDATGKITFTDQTGN